MDIHNIFNESDEFISNTKCMIIETTLIDMFKPLNENNSLYNKYIEGDNMILTEGRKKKSPFERKIYSDKELENMKNYFPEDQMANIIEKNNKNKQERANAIKLQQQTKNDVENDDIEIKEKQQNQYQPKPGNPGNQGYTIEENDDERTYGNYKPIYPKVKNINDQEDDLNEAFNPLAEFEGTYYISLDGNVDENSVFGILTLKKNNIKIDTNYYAEDYKLESADNNFMFKGKSSSITISSDFNQLFTPKAINNKTNFILVKNDDIAGIDPNNFELAFTFADPEIGLDQNMYDPNSAIGQLVCKKGKLTVVPATEDILDQSMFSEYKLANSIENKNSVQCEFIGAPFDGVEAAASLYELVTQFNLDDVDSVEAALDVYSQLVNNGFNELIDQISIYSPELSELSESPLAGFDKFYQEYVKNPEAFAARSSIMDNTNAGLIKDLSDIISDVLSITQSVAESTQYLREIQRHITLTFYVNGHVSGTISSLADPQVVTNAIASQTQPELDLIIFGNDPEVPQTEEEIANAESAEVVENQEVTDQEQNDQVQVSDQEQEEVSPEQAEQVQEALDLALTNHMLKKAGLLIEGSVAGLAGNAPDIIATTADVNTFGSIEKPKSMYDELPESKIFGQARVNKILHDKCNNIDESVYDEVARIYDKFDKQISLNEATDDQLVIIHAYRMRNNLNENADLSDIGNAKVIINIDNINESKIHNVNDLYSEIFKTNNYANTQENINIIENKCLTEDIILESKNSDDNSKASKVKKILKKIGKGLTIGALCGLSAITIGKVTGGAITGTLAKWLSKLPKTSAALSAASKAAVTGAVTTKTAGIAAGTGATLGAVSAGTAAAAKAISDKSREKYEEEQNA